MTKKIVRFSDIATSTSEKKLPLILPKKKTIEIYPKPDDKPVQTVFCPGLFIQTLLNRVKICDICYMAI